MASLGKSILDFYGTLTAGGFTGLRLFPGLARPPLNQSETPQTSALSGQYDLDTGGYVTFALRALDEVQTFENAFETYSLTFTAYAAGAQGTSDVVGSAATMQIMSVIRFNGGSSEAGLGFDNRAVLSTLTDGTLLGIFPNRPPTTEQVKGAKSKGGYPVFTTTMEYRVMLERS